MINGDSGCRFFMAGLVKRDKKSELLALPPKALCPLCIHLHTGV